MKNCITKNKMHFYNLEFDLKWKLTILVMFLSLFQIYANTKYVTKVRTLEQQQQTISGVVVDEKGITIPGASIVEKGTKNGTSSDIDGKFTLKLTANAKTLVVSFVGYETIEVSIGTKKEFKITLISSSELLKEVVIVGYGTQKKSSMVSSITTISAKELKGTSSNLTSMLAGKISGMVAYQRSGEPGADNSDFFIRGLGTFGSGKQNPLILIDGIESSSTDMARLQPDDIESFSVLKDASAASIYGSRGASGVVLITTKSGESGVVKIKFRAEYKMSGNTDNFKFADNITYMNLANEAILTRPLPSGEVGGVPYDQSKIDRTAAGEDPLLYPNNNWIKQLVRPLTTNQGYNINLSGGGEKARYYVAGTYNIDNGVLNVENLNNYNSNIKLRNYSLRSNVNINLNPTTELIVRINGQFDDYNGPNGGWRLDNGVRKYDKGGTKIFNEAIWSNPVAFPAVYPSELLPYIQHPLFGSAPAGNGSTTLLQNPYADMVKGYDVSKSATVQTQLELKKDLGALTQGLKFRAMGYIRRYSDYAASASYNPFYYSSYIDPDTQKVTISVLNDGGVGSIGTPGREFLEYTTQYQNSDSRLYVESALNYNRTFAEKHEVSGMLIGIASNYEVASAANLQASLPSRNLGLSGRFTYAYDNRFLTEINFGYNGSERFAKNNRFGFFPSFAVGYIVSNEKFFEPLKEVIGNLKFRASYGWVGNDQIGNSNDRFFYLSNVNLNDGTYGASFGQQNGYTNLGVSTSRYANENISWEKSKSINLGMDLRLFNSIGIVVDIYKQTRTNILQPRSIIGSTLGLSTTPQTNFGAAESKGADISLTYNKKFSENWSTNLRGNFTYATSKVLKYDEVNYPAELSYLYKKGQSISQTYGYVAERLFVDDNEAKNSPTQFGVPGIDYRGGDIKYRDINGDGVITTQDMVPIGYPTSPEIVYGFGGVISYKDFDFNIFFQGSALSSFFINPRNISPFVTNGGAQNGLLDIVAQDHWSEDNRNVYAMWPRLSSTFIDNNNQSSTWWMRNGAFLRLKTIELGYNAPKKVSERIGLSGLRVYANTTNPAVFSQFKLWDPEMGGNGLGYPIQATYNFGMLLDL